MAFNCDTLGNSVGPCMKIGLWTWRLDMASLYQRWSWDIDTRRLLFAWIGYTIDSPFYAALALPFAFDIGTLNPETSLNTPKLKMIHVRTYLLLALLASLAWGCVLVTCGNRPIAESSSMLGVLEIGHFAIDFCWTRRRLSSTNSLIDVGAMSQNEVGQK